MTPERWKRTEELYHEARTRPPGQRVAFLVDACGDDEALRRDVESLLDEPVSADGFGDTAGFQITPEMVADLAPGAMAGRTIGTYHLHALLGAGGMGEVYLARDSKLGRDVAIKMLPRAFTSDPDRLARLQREARALAALNHPNICAIYGLEEADGLRFLILELVEGATLADELAAAGGSRAQRSGLRLHDGLVIAQQIAVALEIAHDKGIVHRDLKPANVKITPDGVVKVLDFGLAKDLGSDGTAPDLTNAPAATQNQRPEGVLLGTAAYMSPEQACGKRVDRRSDIWAFGVVLFEMMTGLRPFAGETTSETLASVLKTDPDWSALPPTVPGELQRLLHRCLEKDPTRRLQAIGDARIQIDELLAQPDSALVATAGARPALYHRRVWVAATVLVLAIAVAGWSIWTRHLQTVAPSFTRVVRLTHTQANEYGPAISPDGKWVAYLSDARGPIDIWVKFVAGGEASNLTESTGLDVAVRRNAQLEISPDGTAIAARVRTGTGTETWLIPAPLPGAPRKFIEDAASLRWSPDGRRVAYYRVGQTAGESLFVAAADGTNREELVPARGGLHLHQPAWSHDGRYVYFVSTTTRFDQEPAGIFRVAVTGGAAVEPVIQTSRRALAPLLMPDGGGLIYAANPTTADLNLWWRSLGESRAAVRLTTGVGEYAEPRMSADGRRMVATLLDMRQWLVQRPAALPDNVQPNSTDAVMLTHGDTGDVDPTVAPQGPNRLVFSSTRGGSRQLWTTRLDGTDPRPLTSGAGLDERPAVSPDGQQVAFISDRGGERGIWLIGIEGGTPQFLAPAVDVIDMLTWSPDGRQIAYAVVGGALPELRVMSLADKRPRKLQTPAGASAPAWSPTDVIAYLEPLRANSTRVSFINSRGQPLHTNMPPAPNIGFPVVLAWAPDGRRLASAAVEGLWIIEPGSPQPFRRVAEFTGGQRPHGVAWTRDGSSLIVAVEETRGDLVLFER